MRTVGLKVLKNKLSEYVRLAASGEVVQVTDRNRVVAELRPPQPGGPLTDEEFLAKGVREGWITPATGRGKPLLPRRPVASFEEIMRELDQDREDR
jgi:antitoxin (DNA-binding transcriptional repressor) of toxin-antitoxin stability system